MVSIWADVVAKTDGEIYVLSIIKLYSFDFFSLFYQRRSSYESIKVWKHLKWCSYFENPYLHAKIVDKKRINFFVSLYCTLLFSRKEIIKFSEVTLVSVHCNCVIGCIVIAQGYRLWKTANTTVDICLLVKYGNKNTETKYKVCRNFFWLCTTEKESFSMTQC